MVYYLDDVVHQCAHECLLNLKCLSVRVCVLAWACAQKLESVEVDQDSSPDWFVCETSPMMNMYECPLCIYGAGAPVGEPEPGSCSKPCPDPPSFPRSTSASSASSLARSTTEIR